MSSKEVRTGSQPARAPLSEAELLKFSLEVSGIGTWRLDPQSQTVTWDARCKELYGFAADDEVPYNQVLRYMHPEDRPAVDAAVTAAVGGENGGRYEIQFRTVGAADAKLRWLLCKGQAFFDVQGDPLIFAGTAQDISDVIAVQQKVALLERRAQKATAGAQSGTYDFNFKTGDFHYSPETVQIFTGNTDGVLTREDFVGRMHPDDRSIREQAHQEALRTGILTYEVRVKWDDDSLHWVRVNGSYGMDSEGKPETYTGLLEDITDRKLTRMALERSEQFTRGVIDASPIAKFITVGEDLVLQTVNKEMQRLLGRQDGLAGQPLLEAVPQFSNTTLPALLHQVLESGESIEVNEEAFSDLDVVSPMRGHYYHKHHPLRDEAGKVYGVISSWIDITEAVTLRTKAAAAQMLLNAAIETAQLGTFEINPGLGIMEMSPRIVEWMGFEPGDDFTREHALQTLTDAVPLTDGVRKALQADSDGVLDVEYQMVNRKTGIPRFLRSRGSVFLNDPRGPLIVGTTQDITIQRNLSLALEQEVQERTEQLAASNEEMQATVEELAESNTSLNHSNEELAQYAYVASHDLQEPLRKIQVFSGMLSSDPSMTEKSKELLGKISGSSARMTSLIRDLLDFSRLLKSDTLFSPTNLNKVVSEVFNDFELIANEKSAKFKLGNLPVIEAVSLQMNQLFYNLVSNALKFTSPGVVPEISISSKPVDGEALLNYIRKPLPFASYHCICIEDNGIGFEAKYHDQIFEVFKRLHGRDTYPGSGIGLALCRRIITNHSGHLYTESTPGKGATFCLILPDKQHNSPSELPDDFNLIN